MKGARETEQCGEDNLRMARQWIRLLLVGLCLAAIPGIGLVSLAFHYLPTSFEPATPWGEPKIPSGPLLPAKLSTHDRVWDSRDQKML